MAYVSKIAGKLVKDAEAREAIEARVPQVGAAPVTHVAAKNNPHGVTAAQVGARPNTWVPTATDVGARPNTWMPTATDVGAEPAIESTEHPGCYYRMVGDVREWLNPPLVSGVEYRTTERYLGEPVYVFLFDLGYTDGGSRTAAHGRPVARSIEISLMNNAEDITSSGGLHDLGFNTTTIHWNADWAMGGAKFVLKYTK